MILLDIDQFRCNEPLFEGVRIILNYQGENYTPEYVQGISGAAFKIAGGCGSRPTCVYDRWTTDFIRHLGYEAKEYPCFDEAENDITDKMIEAVKKHIDSGKPALVWHAFTHYQYDVVCGYDEEKGHFIGRGTYKGNGEGYAREPWDRAGACDGVPAFGAILIGDKVSDFNSKEAEIISIFNAVKHARKDTEGSNPFEQEGIKFYHLWVEEYSKEGKDRGMPDAYCHGVYSSVRGAAVTYLHGLAEKYESKVSECFRFAAASFEQEVNELKEARPYVSWDSPWGIDEERSKNLAPILKAASAHYAEGIEYLETALRLLSVKTV